MFFQQKEIDTILNCLNCHERFDKPKLLPCGESICETCLKNILQNNNSNKLKCPFCNNIHEIPEDGEFPTQKLLVEILNMKPTKIFRGNLYEITDKLLDDNELLIQNFFKDLNNHEKKIRTHCQYLRHEIGQEKTCLLQEVELYEQKCLNSLENKSIQKDHVLSLYTNSVQKLSLWKDELNRPVIEDTCLKFIYESAKQLEHVLLNSKSFFDSLLFLGQLLVYLPSPNGHVLKYNEFSYSDILNIERLNNSYQASTIDYNHICRNLYNQAFEGIWLSLFTNDCLAICFQIYDVSLAQNRILMKLMDNNGQLLKENNDYVNSEVVTMTTWNKYVVLAVRSNLTRKCQLNLNDFLVSNVKATMLDYEPMLIHCTECFIYVLSNKAPFVRVHDWNLEEKYAFGQDLDPFQGYYMPNVIQIYIRNEKLYVRDGENVFLKVFELNNGSLIKVINVNLVDCLLHIDSIERIIVINQDSKILYIFDEFGKISFEYDLTFIQTITSFCITYNGHLLINDAVGKVMYVA
jgi:hypothetical protein